jgi:type III restriction enzyme
MKLQFDPNQGFQLDAVAAVTDLFDGQPLGAPEYAVIAMSGMDALFAGHERTELGVGNRLLVDDVKLRENLREVQMRNDIDVADPGAMPEAWELFDGPANRPRRCLHFSVEMETGTGTTLQILVINIDAFRKNFTGTEEEQKSNVIYKARQSQVLPPL